MVTIFGVAEIVAEAAEVSVCGGVVALGVGERYFPVRPMGCTAVSIRVAFGAGTPSGGALAGLDTQFIVAVLDHLAVLEGWFRS